MSISIKEYLENPMGKGSAVIPNKKLIQDDLKRRYHDLLYKKKFKPEVYHVKGSFFIVFKIPSESDRDNTYDVVIQFEPTDEAKNSSFVNNYNLKFFSNCPSFTYTYAYVYNDNGLIINNLRSKFDKILLTDAPSMRNPKEVILFEKSTYFACLYINEHRHYMNKMYLLQMTRTYNEQKFLSSIRTTTQVMMEIDKENQRLKEEKLAKRESKKASRKKDTPHAVKPKNVVSKTKSSHKVQPMKKIGSRGSSKKKI